MQNSRTHNNVEGILIIEVMALDDWPDEYALENEPYVRVGVYKVCTNLISFPIPPLFNLISFPRPAYSGGSGSSSQGKFLKMGY